jgi:hypothetical protein
VSFLVIIISPSVFIHLRCIIYRNYWKIQLYMLGQLVACRTSCNWSLAVRSILSNGGNHNLCLVATYLQVQSSCSLFWVAQLDFQTLLMAWHANLCPALCRACDTCACIKTSRHISYGLLQPLDIPACPWKSIPIDFIVKLPTSHKYNSIWVVCNQLM